MIHHLVARTALLVAVASTIALLPATVTAKSWQGQAFDGSWGSTLNWSPLGAPTAGDDVLIGDIPLGHNESTSLDTDYNIGSLTVSNGADANTAGFFLDIAGNLVVGNSGSSFTATQHTSGPGNTVLDVFNIDVNAGGLFNTRGGRTIVAVPGAGAGASGSVSIATGGVLSGWGTLRYQDGLDNTDTTQLFNEGTLRASRDGSAADSQRFTLTIESSDNDNAFVDLDGVSNSGTVSIDDNTTLDIQMPTREFWGTMNFDPGAILELSSTQLVRGTAVLNVNAASAVAGVPSTATIRGGSVNAIGNAQFNIQSGTLVIDSQFDTAAAPDIHMSADTGITFNGVAEINGNLNMDANDISLTVNNDVTVNDAVWNWDGLSGHASNTLIGPGATFTINSDSIETSLDGQMDGNIHINGGHLDASVSTGWTLGGTLVLDGSTEIAQLTGEALRVDGGTLIADTGGLSTVNTSVTFASGSITQVDATLTLGRTEPDDLIRFEGGSNHLGSGTLRFGGDIAVDGAVVMQMPDGVIDFDAGNTGFSQVMDLNADLTVVAGSFDTLGTTSGQGLFTLNVNNTGTTLSVTVANPSNSWTLGANGTINIAAAGTLDTSLAGSDINIEGKLNIGDDTRTTARVHVASGGIIDLPLATTVFQLAGGTTATPNTLSGGIVDGNGTLTSNGTASLSGHGTVNPNISFSSNSDLNAEGGTLVINGQVLAVDMIGTNGSDARLHLGQILNTANASALTLNDGLVSGAGITNNGITRGAGQVNVGTFVNNGVVFGIGSSAQTLSIAATTGVDLDGNGLSGEVEATSGNVSIVSPLTDDFGGTATVGSGRLLEFQSGWTLGTNGTLNLNGAGQIRATVDSTNSVLRGTVNVTGFGRLAGNTTFRADTAVDIATTNDRLEVEGIATVRSGATFTGAGGLSNINTAQLTLEDGVMLDTPVLNSGQIIVAGEATVLTFDQFSTGVFEIDIAGTGTKDYGHLLFENSARIAGSLVVNLTGGFTPALGDQFDILTGAGGIIGTFATTGGQLPALGNGLAWDIDYTGADVILHVVSGGLAGDFNDDGIVNLADYTVWRDHLGASDETALNDNGDGGGVSSSDYTLWKAHFGESTAAAFSSPATAIPEPATVVNLALLCAALLGCAWKTRCQIPHSTAPHRLQ